MDFLAGLNHLKVYELMVNIGRGVVVHPLGALANLSLWFKDCGMVVEEGQSWVVVGTSGAGRDLLLQVGTNHYNS